jgi:hypothetical protein
MKAEKKILFLLLMIIALCNCKDDDIDMSNIDFSNIDNLYAQPLPVIQKAVQGKWKIYSSCGGVAGCSYPENCFSEYTENQLIRNLNGEILINFYSWKKKTVDISGDIVNSYVMWTDGADETAQSGEYFIGIKNDTLYARSCSLTSNYTVFGFTYVRVK